jgi:CubicO group peptidase (beta-lactamase class C family)
VINGNVYANVRGVRKVGTNTPVKIDDRWELGSVSKVLTGELVALYEREGVLSWNDTLDDVIPDRFTSDPNNPFRYVTVAEFMSHTSGLPMQPVVSPIAETGESELASYGGFAARRVGWTEDHALLDAALYPPGTWANYGQGPILATTILEEETGVELERLMSTLYSAAGLTNTNYDLMASSATALDGIYSHSTAANGTLTPLTPTSGHSVRQPVGYGRAGIIDLAKFGWFVTQTGQGTWHSVGLDVWTPTSWGMTVTPVGNPSTSGLFLTKNGSNTNNYAEVWIMPERGISIAVASNANAQQQVRNVLGDILTELNQTTPAWPNVPAQLYPQDNALSANCTSNSPGISEPEDAFDNTYGTKWIASDFASWIECDLPAPVAVRNFTVSETSYTSKQSQPAPVYTSGSVKTFSVNAWTLSVFDSTASQWVVVEQGDYIGPHLQVSLAQSYPNVTKVKLAVASLGADSPLTPWISELVVRP